MPLPADSLESLYIHCSGPAMTVRHKHNNFYKAAGWKGYLQLQDVKAMEDTCDSDMHESHSVEHSLPY